MQNDEFIIVDDIKPASKYHYLVVPLTHIPNINLLKAADIPLCKCTLVEF